MEKYKILLELALHRYDEVNRRNEIIDSKSKSMIAFILKMQEYLNLSEVGDELHCWVY